MKILVSLDHYYLHGGVEKVLATKLNYFLKYYNDVEVYLLTTEQNNNKPIYELDGRVNFIDLGISYNRSKSYWTLENLNAAIKHFFRQKKTIKQVNPDVIISISYNFDHFWLPFIRSSAMLIKERHGSRYNEEVKRQKATFLKKMQFFISDWIEKKYDYIVVLNQDEGNYVKTGNEVVISNPIDIPEYSANLVSTRVLAAGRISPVKNFDDLIDAWRIVIASHPNWKLDIYGQDYQETKLKLESKIRDLGLQGSVFFKDSVDNLQLKMTEYSIFAMTSLTECFPMVLLESMSVGLPVVSYNSPNGPRNIITHLEDGLIVEHLNIKEFAEALNIMMSSVELRQNMGKKAKTNVLRFSSQHIMEEWSSLLKLQSTKKL